MAFIIDYTPAAAAGKAGYQAGLGDWNRFAARQQLAYDQMAFDAARQQQAQQFQALQQSLGMANQRDARREAMAFDWLKHGVARQDELDDIRRRREWAVEDYNVEEENRRDRDALALERQKELFGLQSADMAKRQAEDDARAMALARKNAAWDMVAKGTHAYTQAQRNEMDRLRNERRRWASNKEVPDDVKATKIAEFDELYSEIEDNPEPLRPDEKPMTIDDQIAQQTKTVEQKDGSQLIYTTVPGRNGQPPTLKVTHVPSAQVKVMDDSVKSYMADYMKSKTGTDEDGNPLPAPTPEEYFEVMRKAQAAAAMRLGKDVTPPAPPPQQGPQAQQIPPTPQQQQPAEYPPTPMGNWPSETLESPLEIDDVATDVPKLSDKEIEWIVKSPGWLNDEIQALAEQEWQRRQQKPPAQVPVQQEAQPAPLEDMALPNDIKQWPAALATKTNDQIRELYNQWLGTVPAASVIGREMTRRGMDLGEKPPEPIEPATLDMAIKNGLLPQPKSKAERDALPPNSWYLDPTGTPRLKK